MTGVGPQYILFYSTLIEGRRVYLRDSDNYCEASKSEILWWHMPKNYVTLSV